MEDYVLGYFIHFLNSYIFNDLSRFGNLIVIISNENYIKDQGITVIKSFITGN